MIYIYIRRDNTQYYNIIYIISINYKYKNKIFY